MTLLDLSMPERSNIPAVSVSIVLPAKNESRGLSVLLPELKQRFPDAEIIVVDDGSVDETATLCKNLGVEIVRHAYAKGNGAAIKSGARKASGELIVFMDADGQHDPADISRLLIRLSQGCDMVVGARREGSQASLGRGIANSLYNRLASYVAGHKIEDLTSGFRAVRADKFREFLYLLPNGFSFPATSTIAFFPAGYSVAYEPRTAAKRVASSHIRPLHDGERYVAIVCGTGH